MQKLNVHHAVFHKIWDHKNTAPTATSAPATPYKHCTSDTRLMFDAFV